jgi:8-oxo-dGDP phosphatase
VGGLVPDSTAVSTDPRLEETAVGSRAIHTGRLLRVREDTVTLPGGGVAIREVVEHPGAVAVVAVDDQGRVVLVRQWRHALGRALWEIPAGTRDVDGETPRQTAQRELAEETGLAAQRWRELGSAPLTPGYSTEIMHFFAAEELSEVEAHTDDDELVVVGRFGPEELGALFAESQLDVKTLAGLALAGRAVAT